MGRIWCSECNTFVVGELVPGVSLLEQGHVLSPPHAARVGCEKENAMRIKVTIEVCEPGKEVASATLILEGEQVQSVRLGQWIEQTKSRLCKELAQQLEERKKAS